jgi:hypothetical protein
MTKNYGNIRYPFHRLDESESVVNSFPDLNAVPIFHATSHPFIVTEEDDRGKPVRRTINVDLGGLDNEFVMRYIILMYSAGSPAIEKYPQIGKRKTWVLDELGVQTDQFNKYDNKYLDLLLNQNRLILRKLSTFLTLQQPADWAIMLKSQEDLQEVLGTPMPEDPLKQSHRVKTVELLRQAISESRTRILDGETSRLIESDIDEFMAYTSLGIRPEEIVMMNIKSVPPSHAKAGVVFPESKN